MKAICVEDETILLKQLKAKVEQFPDITDVAAFNNTEEALKYAVKKRIDIAFLDVEINGSSGLDLAAELRKINPAIFIIFCTGYEEYALSAFRVHANGFITKPVCAEDIQDQIENIKGIIRERKNAGKKLTVKCFGNFEVYYQNKPIKFKRKKSKELFAYLIDRRGAAVPVMQIATALWEDDSEDRKLKNNIYQTYRHLKYILDNIGFGDILIKTSTGYAVNTKKIDCDYYKLLHKEISPREITLPEYMCQYSWAEETNARIYALTH